MRIFGIIILCLPMMAGAQRGWFHLYEDSVALVNDAAVIVEDFEAAVHRCNPQIPMYRNTAIKNTTPYLIYLDSATVNLPFWTEVIPPQQQFMAEVCGSEAEGKRAFGLFFNGFYLAHELGHGVAMCMHKEFSYAYDSEYDANLIAILYWRAKGRDAELADCYALAKTMLQHLHDPTPPGQDFKTYLNEHYYEVASDPYQYGYIQFKQFVEIYESTTLPTFEGYVAGLTGH